MVQFINCRFHRNNAGFSGGVALIESANGEVELRIKHSHIKDNKAGRVSILIQRFSIDILTIIKT